MQNGATCSRFTASALSRLLTLPHGFVVWKQNSSSRAPIRRKISATSRKRRTRLSRNSRALRNASRSWSQSFVKKRRALRDGSRAATPNWRGWSSNSPKRRQTYRIWGFRHPPAPMSHPCRFLPFRYFSAAGDHRSNRMRSLARDAAAGWCAGPPAEVPVQVGRFGAAHAIQAALEPGRYRKNPSASKARSAASTRFADLYRPAEGLTLGLEVTRAVVIHRRAWLCGAEHAGVGDPGRCAAG